MKDILAVFKSRRDAISFARMMQRRGARAITVNTPHRISASCGLSVRFDGRNKFLADRILSADDYYSFIGFYPV